MPNSLHFEWISKCIENKKKILVEKPAVLNFKEINNIKDKLGNIFFAEGFMYIYHPQTLKILNLIEEGRIGKLISMEANFGIDIMTKKNFFGFKKKTKINKKNRLFNKELGGGAILDLGCYPVSFSILIASLISKFDFIKTKVLNKKKEIGPTGVDIDSYAELIFQKLEMYNAQNSELFGCKSNLFNNIITKINKSNRVFETNIKNNERKNLIIFNIIILITKKNPQINREFLRIFYEKMGLHIHIYNNLK